MVGSSFETFRGKTRSMLREEFIAGLLSNHLNGGNLEERNQTGFQRQQGKNIHSRRVSSHGVSHVGSRQLSKSLVLSAGNQLIFPPGKDTETGKETHVKAKDSDRRIRKRPFLVAPMRIPWKAGMGEVPHDDPRRKKGIMRHLVRAKAPLRISFCGGGTDVSPYMEERGGVVLSATIDRYAYSTVRPKRGTGLTVRSLDYGIVLFHDDIRRPLPYDGNLDLAKAAINRMNIRKGGSGLELYIHADAPPGSGLGSSSTLVVALLSALSLWKRVPMTSYEIAEMAFRIERSDLRNPRREAGSVFGGFRRPQLHRVHPRHDDRKPVAPFPGNLERTGV
jgi:hypothetical protein